MITFSFTVARPSVTVKADGTLSSGITVLTGQSGSGKSTFIKCIAGLVKPSTGRIQYDEITWVDRAKKIWVPAQERQVGYMPQGNIVFPHLSVESNIIYSKRGTPDMCDNLLSRLGLEKYRKTKAGVYLVVSNNGLPWDVPFIQNRLFYFLMSLCLRLIGICVNKYVRIWCPSFVNGMCHVYG